MGRDHLSDKPYLDDLTVFIISSGEETEEDCRAALDAQDCGFLVESISGVAPMSAAFQAMPDRCQTPYFIQVDADMILNPDAVSILYKAVRRAPFWVYRVSGALYEEGFGVGGAVKCWKKNVFRITEFRDARTVDRNLQSRLRRFGLTIRHLEQVVGIHRPRHSEFSVYLKAKADVEKWRYLKRPSGRYALPLLDEVIKGGADDRQRMFGVLMGALTGANRLVRSKDAPFEEELFAELMNVLGIEKTLAGYKAANAPDVLKSIFATAYDDFRGQNFAARQNLALRVFDLFSPLDGGEDGRVEALLRAADA